MIFKVGKLLCDEKKGKEKKQVILDDALSLS
jgi:hypothetical protein